MTRPGPTPHAFRHTYGRNCVLRGVPIPVLQKWLGHSSLTDTQRYVELAGAHHEWVSLDFTQNPGKVMDDITFVRSHWWLVSEGFSLSTATPMYRNSPPLCTIVLQIPSLMPLKMRKVQLAGCR